jgi:Lipase (class 3)
MDKVEDFDVAEMHPFDYAAGTRISNGAQDAIAKVIGAMCVTESAGSLTGTTLVQALTQLIAATPKGSLTTLYLTGHSLGGAIATTVSLYLLSQHWPDVIFQVYTFAAPTAGDAAFAQAFDIAFPNVATTDNSSWRVINAFDVVPNAWQTLETVEKTYYPAPGPAASFMVKVLIDGMGFAAGGNAYVQPNQPAGGHAVVLNADYRLYDPGDTAGDLHAFLGQLAFQHGCSAYLQLLGAPLVKFAP